MFTNLLKINMFDFHFDGFVISIMRILQNVKNHIFHIVLDKYNKYWPVTFGYILFNIEIKLCKFYRFVLKGGYSSEVQVIGHKSITGWENTSTGYHAFCIG